jgi:hypothetical protein
MTEEPARSDAEALANRMGITFYVVRDRVGEYLAVQSPPDDCKVLATIVLARTRLSARGLRIDGIDGVPYRIRTGVAAVRGLIRPSVEFRYVPITS